MVDTSIWKLKLGSFLHDPPDKALRIDEHNKRALEVLLQPLDISLNVQEQRAVEIADHIASAMQRINIPEEVESMIIDFTTRLQPTIHHTLSGKVERPIITSKIESIGVNLCLIDVMLKERVIRFKGADSRVTFLRVWRSLPEEEPLYNDLPADTRIPDHSIWDHLDVVSGLTPSLEGGLAFLSFKLTPVQEFIEHARKTADLWAGSHILSYLAFNAMLPIVEELGPDAIIFPSLRGQPFLDNWLISQGVLVDGFNKKNLEISNIPHRFLAIIPANRLEYFEYQVKQRLTLVWQDIAEFVRKEFVNLLQDVPLDSDSFFDETWQRQIQSTFNAYTASIKWAYPAESDQAVEDWLRQVKVFPKDLWDKYEILMNWYRRPGKYKANAGVLYGLYYELVGLLIDQKSRLFDGEDEPPEKGGKEGGKCTICGIRNQLRIQNMSAADFWEKVRNASRFQYMPWIVEENERLCAVCLIKRLYRRYVEKRFSVIKETPSVASIATRAFRKLCIEKAKAEIIDFMKAHFAVKKGVVLQFTQNIERELIQDFQNENALDGEWLFQESYTEDYIKSQTGREPNKDELQRVNKALRELYEKVDSQPASYYAILAMDGDRIGFKLRGENLPSLAHFLHKNIKDELSKHGDLAEMINKPRVLNPNVHMAISRSLKDFSTIIVKEVVEDHKGVLIYSGGDDVLAFLPAAEALRTALEINSWFGRDFVERKGKRLSMLGSGSTMSAGIVFAHYKYPLYDALSKAREARDSAKEDYGRATFVLTSIKHSGQTISVGGKWSVAESLLFVVEMLLDKKISPRFIYELLNEAQVIEGIEQVDAVKSEVNRLLVQHQGEKTMQDDINRLVEAIINIYSNVSQFETLRGKALEHVVNLVKIAFDAARG